MLVAAHKSAIDATPKEVGEWVSYTEANLSKLRELRKKVCVQLRGSEHDSQNVSTFSLDSSRGFRTAAVEDKLKKRITRMRTLGQNILRHVEGLEQAAFTINKNVAEIQRVSGMMKASLMVVDKRVQLRSKRPAPELVDDDFQKALESERVVLESARQKLA
jgi:hypothetical protein